MSHTVYLPAPVRAQLATWAEAGYPLETCGVLVGAQAESQVRIERAERARNLNTERAQDRYELAAEDLLAADAAARAEGLEVVGIWHSHPDHPARPSETDRAQAWEGWSYIILAVQQGRMVELRSWRLASEAFQEESIQA